MTRQETLRSKEYTKRTTAAALLLALAATACAASKPKATLDTQPGPNAPDTISSPSNPNVSPTKGNIFHQVDLCTSIPLTLIADFLDDSPENVDPTFCTPYPESGIWGFVSYDTKRGVHLAISLLQDKGGTFPGHSPYNHQLYYHLNKLAPEQFTIKTDSGFEFPGKAVETVGEIVVGPYVLVIEDDKQQPGGEAIRPIFTGSESRSSKFQEFAKMVVEQVFMSPGQIITD